MDVLFLSHCVPNPPDKGEKIRAYHMMKHLAGRCRLHLACLARSDEELEAARELKGICATVYSERIRPLGKLAGTMIRFAGGASLSASYYASSGIKRYVERLKQETDLKLSVCYTAVMAPMSPAGVPMILDLVDVDSEKWLQYASSRQPAFLYGLEGRRFRKFESQQARKAACTLLCTRQELALFRSFEQKAASDCLENGVDLNYFDPDKVEPLAEAHGRRVVVFTGVMDYFPNSDGACRFVRDVFAGLHRRHSDIEFWIVGRNPSGQVKSLAVEPGVRVVGGVPDIRPYLRSAHAVVAPLRIARGIQNKVLEALAMGKRVLASGAVCKTFGETLPVGVDAFETADDIEGVLARVDGRPDAVIREAAGQRFSWDANVEMLWKLVERVTMQEAGRLP
jgi:polysaccharide biosynthesis protein PslH